MIRTIDDFVRLWSQELEGTQKILKHLTTESLNRPVVPDHRTLGRVAWHLTTSLPEMMQRVGLAFSGITPEDPVPATAKQIFDAYSDAAVAVLEQVKGSWTDATLQVEDDMYGEKWKRGSTLLVLVLHQTHHRAQLTVMMRLAGLAVPGVYGPAKEEWTAFGMEPPAV
jgi:uncharacterized damage-inducible protein DinB